jgi:hypothetical protein
MASRRGATCVTKPPCPGPPRTYFTGARGCITVRPQPAQAKLQAFAARRGSEINLPGRASKRANRGWKRPGLLTQTQLGQGCLVELRILARQIALQAAPASDHHQQAAPRMVVVFVLAEMLGQLRNPASQKSNLDRGRTDIALFRGKFGDCLGLLFSTGQTLPLLWSHSTQNKRTPKAALLTSGF